MGISTGAGMKRRKFITLLGATAILPLVAYAQEPKVRRVGALLIGNADLESFQTELREGLRELGYIEGQNILFEFRSAEGIIDRLTGLAAELVRLKVYVIVALYTPCGLAARDATREIPIVLLTGDPRASFASGLALAFLCRCRRPDVIRRGWASLVSSQRSVCT